MKKIGIQILPLRMDSREMMDLSNYRHMVILLMAFTVMAVLPTDLLAQVTFGSGGSSGGSDWSSSLVTKAEGFKVGLVSIVAVLLGIGGVIIAGYGAVAGDIPWRRVGALIFGAIFLAGIDQFIPALTGS